MWPCKDLGLKSLSSTDAPQKSAEKAMAHVACSVLLVLTIRDVITSGSSEHDILLMTLETVKMVRNTSDS